MDASFLTFHCLSTTSKSTSSPYRTLKHLLILDCHLILYSLLVVIGKVEPQSTSANRSVNSGGASSTKRSIPVFGLASYKLRCSILMPNISQESQELNSLVQVADNWLRRLQVRLPDYEFFMLHSSNGR